METEICTLLLSGEKKLAAAQRGYLLDAKVCSLNNF